MFSKINTKNEIKENLNFLVNIAKQAEKYPLNIQRVLLHLIISYYPTMLHLCIMLKDTKMPRVEQINQFIYTDNAYSTILTNDYYSQLYSPLLISQDLFDSINTLWKRIYKVDEDLILTNINYDSADQLNISLNNYRITYLTYLLIHKKHTPMFLKITQILNDSFASMHYYAIKNNNLFLICDLLIRHSFALMFQGNKFDALAILNDYHLKAYKQIYNNDFLPYFKDIILTYIEQNKEFQITRPFKEVDQRFGIPPIKSEICLGAGIFYKNMGQLALAEDILKKAILLDPYSPANYNTLGNVYKHQGKFDESKQAFKKALSLMDSSYSEAFFNMADSIYQKM